MLLRTVIKEDLCSESYRGDNNLSFSVAMMATSVPNMNLCPWRFLLSECRPLQRLCIQS